MPAALQRDRLARELRISGRIESANKGTTDDKEKEMKRMNAFAIAVATMLMATAANAAPLDREIQAPRGENAQAPRGENAQAPRGENAQAPRR